MKRSELPAEFKGRLALTVKEVSKLLGISTSGVRSMIRKGQLPGRAISTGLRAHAIVPVVGLLDWLDGVKVRDGR